MNELNIMNWFFPEARARLLVVHGLGEHIGRYERFAQRLKEIGKIEVFGFDLPGHGKNRGLRGKIGRFDLIFDTMDHLINEYGSKPLFLFGHSLGGLIALRYVQKRRNGKIMGLILSSPALGMKEGTVSPFLFNIAKILNLLFPSFRFDNRIDVSKLSRNEKVVKEYLNDPLVHRKITVDSFFEILRNMERIWEELDSLRLPLLVMYGTKDEIISTGEIEKFYDSIQTDKEMVKFEDGYHELFEDPQHGKNFHEKIVEWILKRMGESEKGGKDANGQR